MKTHSLLLVAIALAVFPCVVLGDCPVTLRKKLQFVVGPLQDDLDYYFPVRSTFSELPSTITVIDEFRSFER